MGKCRIKTHWIKRIQFDALCACPQCTAYFGYVFNNPGKVFNKFQLLDLCVKLRSCVHTSGPRWGDAIFPPESESAVLNCLRGRMTGIKSWLERETTRTPERGGRGQESKMVQPLWKTFWKKRLAGSYKVKHKLTI